MRFPALLLCLQQFIVNLVAEVMNMMILCQLPDFNELVMNYVTFAEILNLDNLYISTQLKYNGDLKEVIDDTSSKPWLRRFKNDKFHRNDQASKLTRFCENLVRIIYKLIYFYLLPLLVIPVGYLGYMRDLKNVKKEEGIEDYSWDKYLKSKSEYPIQDEVDGDYIRRTNFNFSENDSMQLYMFTVLTITGLGLRIGQLYMLKGMSWDKIMLTNPFFSRSRFVQFILSVPFLVMIAFKILLFMKDHLLSKLLLVGLYFKFLPDESDKYNNCQLSDLESHDCDFLQWANLYFYFFLIFNLIDTEFQRASFVDYTHFVFKTLGQPVLVYKIFNDLLYSITLQPWLDPESDSYSQTPPRRGANEIRVKQILFLVCFLFIKLIFYDREQKCYNDEIDVKEKNSEGEDNFVKKPKTQKHKRNLFIIITFFTAFGSFIFCQIVGDLSFALKDKMDNVEPSEFSNTLKEMVFGVWRAKVDTWMQYMQFDKAGAYIEVYTLLFLLFCIYQFASGWYIKYKIEMDKLDEEEKMKNSIQKQLLKMREKKLLDTKKKQDLSKSKVMKIKTNSTKNIFRMKAFLFILVPFQTYFFINFGLSAWYKFVLQYGLSQTFKTNRDVVSKINPIVFFMSAFSAPYFFMSLLIQQILKVVQYLLDNWVIPPWEEFRLSAHNSEFKWYKFWIYYQIYFSILVVYLAYVRWNIYQLKQVRYKSNPRGKENGHLLHKISKNPYTFAQLKKYEEDMKKRQLEHSEEEQSDSNIENMATSNEPEIVLVQCSNCKRVIPDGEIFKHCSVFTEDYCQNCWIVDPDQVKNYLAGSMMQNSSSLSQTVEMRLDKSKRLNSIQNWFTGHNIKLGEGEFMDKLSKHIYILTIPGSPALMYLLINIILYYFSYWLISVLIFMYSLNSGVSQVLIGILFLALAAFICKQIVDSDDDNDQGPDDENEGDLSADGPSNQEPLLNQSIKSTQNQTLRDKVIALAPKSPSVLYVLLFVTLAMAVSQFILFGKQKLARKLKLDFYTSLVVTVVAALIWEHSIPERFDQTVAVIISIVGILLIGQHVLNQIAINYTWHVLELVPPDLSGLDLADTDEIDYCRWLRGPYYGQGCTTN